MKKRAPPLELRNTRDGLKLDDLANDDKWQEVDNDLAVKLVNVPRARGDALRSVVEEALEGLRQRDFGIAFLLWSRMYTSTRPDFRNAAEPSVWRFARAHHIPHLKGVWRQVPAPTREKFVHYVFAVYPGLPFELFATGKLPWGRTGFRYVPSLEIKALRDMVEQAGDPHDQELVRQLLEAYRDACER